jgi:hypothetical protein
MELPVQSYREVRRKKNKEGEELTRANGDGGGITVSLQ